MTVLVGCSDDDGDVARRNEASDAVEQVMFDALTDDNFEIDTDVTDRPNYVRAIARITGDAIHDSAPGDVPLFPSPAGFMGEVVRDDDLPDVHGPDATAVMEQADEFFGSFFESDAFVDMSDSDARRVAGMALAIGIVIAAGGPISENLAGLALDSADAGELVDSVERMRFTDDLGRYVRETYDAIYVGFDDAVRLS